MTRTDAPVCFPDWFAEFQVEDNAFAAAYDLLSALQRSWIKKTIALASEMFASQGGGTAGRMRVANDTSLGLLECASVPLDSVVVLTDQYTGPVRLAAAVTPALLAGVSCVAAVRVDQGEFSPACLAALELAGVETAVVFGPVEMIRLYKELGTTNSGIIDLRLESSRMIGAAIPGAVRSWTPEFDQQLHLWCEADELKNEDAWDLELLQLVHGPDNVVLCGPGAHAMADSYDGEIEINSDDFRTMVDNGAIPVLLDDAMLTQVRQTLAHTRAPHRLMLGRSTAQCWLWPDLTPDFFRVSSLACLPDNLL